MRELLANSVKVYHWTVTFILVYLVLSNLLNLYRNVCDYYPNYNIFAIWAIVLEVLVAIAAVLMLCQKVTGVFLYVALIIADVIFDCVMRSDNELWLNLFFTIITAIGLFAFFFLKKEVKSAWQVLKEGSLVLEEPNEE